MDTHLFGRGFLGIVNTDRYAAYHWVDAHRRQLCWAHLKREFEAIKERGGASAEIGAGLLGEVKEIFDLWHRLKAGSLNRQRVQQEMEPVQSSYLWASVAGQKSRVLLDDRSNL